MTTPQPRQNAPAPQDNGHGNDDDDDNMAALARDVYQARRLQTEQRAALGAVGTSVAKTVRALMPEEVLPTGKGRRAVARCGGRCLECGAKMVDCCELLWNLAKFAAMVAFAAMVWNGVAIVMNTVGRALGRY